jgi:hypothetical protein
MESGLNDISSLHGVIKNLHDKIEKLESEKEIFKENVRKAIEK